VTRTKTRKMASGKPASETNPLGDAGARLRRVGLTSQTEEPFVTSHIYPIQGVGPSSLLNLALGSAVHSVGVTQGRTDHVCVSPPCT